MNQAMKSRGDALNPMRVGGQAVIEGVMMRAPGMVATALRRVSGTIEIRKEPFRSMTERYAVLGLPVVRGAVSLLEMMVIGIQTLNFSADVAMRDADGGSDNGDGRPAGRSGRMQKVILGFTVVAALAIGLALFFALPLLLTSALSQFSQNPVIFNLIAGAVRITILLAYLGLISRSKEIHRLFQYHGAEHKAVFAFERRLPLTVESASAQSRFHPRCGTSFLLVVLLASVMFFAFLDVLVISLTGPITIVTRLCTHLPLVPLVGGLSYEGIRLSAKHAETSLGKIIVAPGLWLQRITTQEPDAPQLEVALAALRSALGMSGMDESVPVDIAATTAGS